MAEKTIIEYKFAEEYSKYPGGRFERLGPYSGEDFRDNVLRKVFETEGTTIVIDATGVITSFSPSFLDECFGQLAREYGLEIFNEKLTIYSDDNPGLLEKMMYYVERAVNVNK